MLVRLRFVVLFPWSSRWCCSPAAPACHRCPSGRRAPRSTDTRDTDARPPRRRQPRRRRARANRAFACCRPATSRSTPAWPWRARAERSLDVQYYQLQRDSVGLRFLRELGDAARRGVRVRLLVDDLYTAGEDELFRSFAALPNVAGAPVQPAAGARRLARSARLVLVAARVRPHQPPHAQQAVRRRQPLLGLRRPQHGRRVLHAQRRGQLHRHGRDRRRPGRARAVAGVRPLLEQRARLAGRRRRPGDARCAARRNAASTSWFGTPRPISGWRPTTRSAGIAVGFELAAGQVSLAFARSRSSPTRRPRSTAANRSRHASRPSPAACSRRSAAPRQEVLIASPYFIPGPIGMAHDARGARARHPHRDHHQRRSAPPTSRSSTGATRATGAKMLKLGVELYELSPDAGARRRHVRQLRQVVRPPARQGRGDRPAQAVRRLDEPRPALGLVEHRGRAC